MILKVYLPGRMKLCLGRKDAGVLSGRQEIHYIGGSEILPPPLESVEESEAINDLDTEALARVMTVYFATGMHRLPGGGMALA